MHNEGNQDHWQTLHICFLYLLAVTTHPENLINCKYTSGERNLSRPRESCNFFQAGKVCD